MKSRRKTRSLTQARVHELFNYDATTGVLRWRVARGGMKPGDVAGCDDGKGHWMVGVDYGLHQAARIIWLWMTGKNPTHEVDHRDGNGQNNRWLNLRAATHKQNLENLSRRGQGLTGFRGVGWDRFRSRWTARIEHHGQSHRLGRFDTIVDAVAARLAAERAMFTHHREVA